MRQVIILAIHWLSEIFIALGKFFLQPIFYWGILLFFLSNYIRIQKERYNFGIKIFQTYSEIKGIFGWSIFYGMILSFLTIGVGFVWTEEVFTLLCIVTILLSIHLKYTLLSPSYTIGVTSLLILLSPLLESTYGINFYSEKVIIGLSLLMGLLLMVESMLIKRVKRNDFFPELIKSERGVWVGQHRLKKLSLIPFFVLIPMGNLHSFADYWPYFSFGDETYSLLLVPFFIGFDYPLQSSHLSLIQSTYRKSSRLLGMIVLLVAITGIFIPILAILAIIIGIAGKEVVNYRIRTKGKKQSFFNPLAEELRVLAILPNTPADKLGILVGEIIYRVNDQRVSTEAQFYEALNQKGAYFKLEVIDDQNEIRFLQGPLYEQDHHQLGIVFTNNPYRKIKTS